MAEKSSIPSLILSQKFYTASVNMIEHDFKIWNVSIVRIVNYQLSFGIICSKQFYLRSRSSIGWLKSFIQITYIAVIKGQYYIETTKIIFVNLPCSVIIHDSMFLQYLQPSLVWAKSFVEIKNSSAVDLPLISIVAFLYKVSKDCFSGWRTTNIPETNEQDFAIFVRIRHIRLEASSIIYASSSVTSYVSHWPRTILANPRWRPRPPRVWVKYLHLQTVLMQPSGLEHRR